MSKYTGIRYDEKQTQCPEQISKPTINTRFIVSMILKLFIEPGWNSFQAI